MSEIVVIGTGFAGCTAVKSLRKQGYEGEITLISPRPTLFYYPSLIWVPAGLRDEESLTVHLEGFFDHQRVKFQHATVTGLDPANRKVLTNQGDVDYQYLIIASGGRFIRKLPGIEHIFIPCEGFAATQAYSERLAAMEGGTLAFGFSANPKEPSAVRGGPMFEFLFGIDTLLRQQQRRDKFELVFFSPAPKPGIRLGEDAVKNLLKEMERRGIRTHLGHKLKGFTETEVLTEGGNLHSDLTLFMPGVTGPAWLPESGLPQSEGGFITVDDYCRVPGFDEIFVAGDSGSFPGPDWIPKQAHMADLQAQAAVKNLLAIRNRRQPTEKYQVELICIVDTLNSGVLVYRDLKRTFLSKGFWYHWAKRFFEWYYLRAYR